MKNIRLALANIGTILFRNNVGTLKDKNGQYVTFGLCVGSSDLIGWKTIEIMPEMLGRKYAVFVACEVKQPGKFPTIPQQRFIAAVREAGGIGVVATSVEEALDAIQRQR